MKSDLVQLMLGIGIGAGAMYFYQSVSSMGSTTATVLNTPANVLAKAQSGTSGTFSSPAGFVAAYQSLYGQGQRRIGQL